MDKLLDMEVMDMDRSTDEKKYARKNARHNFAWTKNAGRKTTRRRNDRTPKEKCGRRNGIRKFAGRKTAMDRWIEFAMDMDSLLSTLMDIKNYKDN